MALKNPTDKGIIVTHTSEASTAGGNAFAQLAPVSTQIDGQSRMTISAAWHMSDRNRGAPSL
ncbi:MAG: hypothetical protein KIS68_13400 [Bauldia sp.]|nr:hypothetical protein [Bauldia sp.]